MNWKEPAASLGRVLTNPWALVAYLFSWLAFDPLRGVIVGHTTPVQGYRQFTTDVGHFLQNPVVRLGFAVLAIFLLIRATVSVLNDNRKRAAQAEAWRTERAEEFERFQQEIQNRQDKLHETLVADISRVSDESSQFPRQLAANWVLRGKIDRATPLSNQSAEAVGRYRVAIGQADDPESRAIALDHSLEQSLNDAVRAVGMAAGELGLEAEPLAIARPQMHRERMNEVFNRERNVAFLADHQRNLDAVARRQAHVDQAMGELRVQLRLQEDQLQQLALRRQ